MQVACAQVPAKVPAKPRVGCLHKSGDKGTCATAIEVPRFCASPAYVYYHSWPSFMGPRSGHMHGEGMTRHLLGPHTYIFHHSTMHFHLCIRFFFLTRAKLYGRAISIPKQGRGSGQMDAVAKTAIQHAAPNGEKTLLDPMRWIIKVTMIEHVAPSGDGTLIDPIWSVMRPP